jgi:uncharacterized DUF497 family protein
MDYEWDPAKNEANIRDRGLDFADAYRVFEGEAFVDQEDTRRAYGELRMNAIGKLGPGFVHVTYTDRPGVRRIISMRAASRKERRQWQATFDTP